MNTKFNRKLLLARKKFNTTLNLEEQKFKEELLVRKLENKLGKSANEVRSMLSEGLLSLLTQVPFSVRYEKKY